MFSVLNKQTKNLIKLEKVIPLTLDIVTSFEWQKGFITLRHHHVLKLSVTKLQDPFPILDVCTETAFQSFSLSPSLSQEIPMQKL